MGKKLDALLGTLEGVKNPKETVAVIHDNGPAGVNTVAFVECPANLTTPEKLEFAFMKTNSINDAWYNNTEVLKMFDGDGCRSTMTGDMVLVGKEKFVCEAVGWKKI